MKRGILLMNLGSPDSTEVKDVKRYLDEFLMDERVIDKPWLLRLLLVKGIITPFRAAKSAEAYKTIWTKEGSPLVVLTKQLQQALQQQISEPVEIAMRYGSLTPARGFDELLKREPALEEVIAVPLYPHYAMSSYETAVEHAKKTHREKKYPFSLRFIKPFFDEPSYINALAENIRPYLDQPYDHILFSYHGIPARHIHRNDPVSLQKCVATNGECVPGSAGYSTCYKRQVFETTKLVMQQLTVPADGYSISFQSRLGKGWLEPFTDIRLEQMPKEGIKKLLILCPAFVSDCLETLEEIEERGKEVFMQAGGESYKMIPCLNTHPLWVSTLKNWVEEINSGKKDMLLA
ncbi:ferrochelatase [Terrimonas pollutisoli]|uniref:ferrochelatase n=1 Tax=Terrimonas pollutisoli TaxID=3034147 RepID=UPI0023EB6A1E|nr:ferrochelatase [Terrimonas sp. H1YJ31]